MATAVARRTPGLSGAEWPLIGFIVTLMLAPLWYGSVLVPAQIGNCAALAVIGLSIAIFHGERFRRPAPTPFVLSAALFATATSWAVAQASSLAPATLSHPLWQLAAESLRQPLAGRISLDPAGTWLAIGEWLTLGLAFTIAFILGRKPENARHILYAIGISGAVCSIYGILDVVLGINHVLFVPKNPYTLAQGMNYVAGTFINADHYAAFAGLAVIVLATLIASDLGKAIGPVPERRGSLARKLLKTFPSVASTTLGLLLPCLIGVLLSSSRAGIASLFAGLLVVAALYILRSGSLRFAVVAAVLAAAAVLVLADLAFALLAQKMTRLSGSLHDRLSLYAIVVDIVRSNPWAGFGLGAFESYFPLYRDARGGIGGIWNAAHNSYLELVASLGIPAGVCFLLATAIPAARCAYGAVIRERHATAAIAATAATAQLGLHSLFDFPLQIQAVALAYAATLGVGLAQAYKVGSQVKSSTRDRAAR